MMSTNVPSVTTIIKVIFEMTGIADRLELAFYAAHHGL